ncbi:MAG: hypothetical protein ACI4LS_05345, partial [Treponema sp.]
KLTKQKQAIRPSLPLIRFPRFAQSSGLLRRGYYPCHVFIWKQSFKQLPLQLKTSARFSKIIL